jgi:NHLM bacteriocin system ABC transporter ATP-binding protein
MGWFNELISKRVENDEQLLNEAFADLSSVVIGKQAARAALNVDSKRSLDAIGEILKYYRVPMRELPENIQEVNAQLEYLLHPSGIMKRAVTLREGWYKDASGPMLAVKKKGGVVALIPSGFIGYKYMDYEAGTEVKVNKANALELGNEAICFYKPLPQKKLSRKDLLKFISDNLVNADLAYFAAAVLAVTMLGLLVPYINRLVFAKIIPSGEMRLILPVSIMLLGAAISTFLINITKNLVMARIESNLTSAVQSAVMARMLSLPAGFFKKQSAGELATRASYLEVLCKLLVEMVLSVSLTSLFALMYIGQILSYAPSLLWPALVIIASTLIFSILSILVQVKVSRNEMKQSAKTVGLIYALFSGIQKIKLGGAERRAFARWSGSYTNAARYRYNPPFFLKINAPIAALITGAGTIFIYYMAARSRVPVSDYMAFNSAYGMVSAAVASLAGVALTLATLNPIMEMVDPIMQAEPELSGDKQADTKISGNLELSNVSFRYVEHMPLVINNLSLKIRKGQYIAIVGRTGCGKSTLIRLLLGFEKPQKGAVYYDGRDISKIDVKSLRRSIGVVMQDGKLIQGSIYENIVISAPWLSLDDAWAAAETAGIAEDIRAMPMGMFTMISEGGGCISGGQKQRLMIARAIAPKPRLLMLDEATSALDNITQKQIAESLDRLKCTRIVIAHRLSTIRQCDRIIVLQAGSIAEDGTYEELIARGGLFADLVARQRLDVEQAKA